MNKWVYSVYGLHLHQLVIDMEKYGYNGLVLQVPDHITEAYEWHPLAKPLADHCRNHNIELIPMMCAVGKLNHWMKKNKPEFIEMMPAGTEYEWKPDINKYEIIASHYISRPASVIQTDGKLQMAGCMANEQLAEWYDAQINFVIEHTGCTKIFLSLDEIRAGGTCERCKGSDVKMMLYRFVSDFIDVQKMKNRDIDFYAWGDMFDPTHNARHPYFHLSGSTEGALDMILESHPDFKVVSWGDSTYYVDNYKVNHVKSINIDTEDLVELPQDDNRLGIMYTTWRGDYSLLKQFADTYFGATQ